MTKFRKSGLLLVLCALLLLPACTGATQDESAQTAATAVEVVKLAKGSIQTEYIYSGQIKPVKQLSVVSKVSGKVATVNFDVGDAVKENDILFVMDEKDVQNSIDILQAQLASADAGVASARTALEMVNGSTMQNQIAAADAAKQRAQLALDDAKTNYENSQALFAADAISQVQLTQAEAAFKQAQLSFNQAAESYRLLTGSTIEENRRMAQNALNQALAGRAAIVAQIENAKDTLHDTAVRAPIAGVVTARSAEAGAMLSSAQSPFTIMQLDTVTVNVNVSEQSISSLKEGALVDVYVSSLSDQAIKGKITLLSPAADEIKNTYLVRIELDNKDGRFRPGMLAEVRFLKEKSDNALVLPRGAVLGSGEDSHVYIEENGIAKRVNVKTGIDNGAQIEIVSGLAENQSVVIKGQSFLADGDPVNVVSGAGEVK